jgi:hypothetical protein
MTCYALTLSNFAKWRDPLLQIARIRPLHCRRWVACGTFLIVKGWGTIYGVVRVMAREATDPVIVRVITAAAGEAIRLEPNAANACEVHQLHLLPSAVAGATKIQ